MHEEIKPLTTSEATITLVKYFCEKYAAVLVEKPARKLQSKFKHAEGNMMWLLNKMTLDYILLSLKDPRKPWINDYFF